MNPSHHITTPHTHFLRIIININIIHNIYCKFVTCLTPISLLNNHTTYPINFNNIFIMNKIIQRFQNIQYRTKYNKRKGSKSFNTFIFFPCSYIALFLFMFGFIFALYTIIYILWQYFFCFIFIFGIITYLSFCFLCVLLVVLP